MQTQIFTDFEKEFKEKLQNASITKLIGYIKNIQVLRANNELWDSFLLDENIDILEFVYEELVERVANGLVGNLTNCEKPQDHATN